MIHAALATVLLLCAPEEELDELEALQQVLQAAVDRVAPSVVRVTTVGGVRHVEVPPELREKMTVPERPRGEGDGEGDGEEAPEGRTPRFRNEFEKMLALRGFKKAEGPTTGVIVSSEGHIVTSAWNFDSKPQVIVVTLGSGRSYPARLLGIDRAAGLALVKIDAEGLPVPEFLDPDEVRVGAWAFALGRAIARDHVEVKYGILSAKNRIDGNALQTDAATSPTNYGGPLVDIHGRVYGILVPLGARGEAANPNWYDSGIGFAAPVPDPRRLIERLGKESVVLEPAFLGVGLDEDRTEEGARITEIVPGQAAEKAGLAVDDVVLAVDGEKVENAFTLRFAIGRKRAGDRLRLKIRRGQDESEVEVVLGTRPSGEQDPKKIPVPMPAPGGGREREKR